MKMIAMMCMGAGMFWASPALAQTAEDRATIIDSCLSDLKLSEAACACVADKAEAELDANAHHLFAVALGDPTAVSTVAAANAVTPEQMQAMGLFMVTAPTQCAQATTQ